MNKLRYLAWSLTILYLLSLALIGVFIKDLNRGLNLGDRISTPIDFEMWIQDFQVVVFVCLSISIVLSLLWCSLAWKYFKFGLSGLSKPYYRICWASLFILCGILSLLAMHAEMEMPINGRILVSLFLVFLDCMIPYYLFTLVYTPSGAKFVPVLGKTLRGAMW